MKGTTKWFNNKKGYGFITGEDGKEHFIHYTNIKRDGFKTLKEGEAVTYDLTTDSKGKECAVNVIPA